MTKKKKKKCKFVFVLHLLNIAKNSWLSVIFVMITLQRGSLASILFLCVMLTWFFETGSRCVVLAGHLELTCSVQEAARAGLQYEKVGGIWVLDRLHILLRASNDTVPSLPPQCFFKLVWTLLEMLEAFLLPLGLFQSASSALLPSVLLYLVSPLAFSSLDC